MTRTATAWPMAAARKQWRRFRRAFAACPTTRSTNPREGPLQHLIRETAARGYALTGGEIVVGGRWQEEASHEHQRSKGPCCTEGCHRTSSAVLRGTHGAIGSRDSGDLE